jgi:hypothetical protein
MTKQPELRADDGAGFSHPGDAIDAADNPTEPSSELLAGEQAQEIFWMLFAGCLPNGGVYRGARRWKAGYNRMVAIAYLTAPEVFVGMNKKQVACELDIDERVFRRLLREVAATLQARTAATVRRTSRKGSKE